MAKFVTNYVCQQCGYVSPSFLGKCPNCGSWNSFVEQVEQTSKASSRVKGGRAAKPVKLSEVAAIRTKRVSTGMAELDQVLGGGMVSGMAVLLSGEPGIGKSTLLLEIARNFSGPVLYVAGEESAAQIKIRTDRLKIKTYNIEIYEETDVDAVVSLISEAPVSSLLIIDSIQTMTTADLVGTAGSVGQVRECASRLISAAKQAGIPLFLVGHVTKEGAIAGPKVLEHAVDTVLSIEGERYGNLRLVRSSKNRFGPTDEVGVFEVTDAGFKPVSNASELFAEVAHASNPGSCLTITMEGTRPLLVEVQALVTSTPLPTPRRVASGVDYNRLQTIVAILQKRLNLPLFKEDIYVSVAGGLSISEPAMDLPIALAIISSFYNRALPPRSLAIGELDLLGNVRSVSGLPRRVKEAQRLGFGKVLSAETLSNLAGFSWAVPVKKPLFIKDWRKR